MVVGGLPIASEMRQLVIEREEWCAGDQGQIKVGIYVDICCWYC